MQVKSGQIINLQSSSFQPLLEGDGCSAIFVIYVIIPGLFQRQFQANGIVITPAIVKPLLLRSDDVIWRANDCG
jgi:hypothetical protein